MFSTFRGRHGARLAAMAAVLMLAGCGGGGGGGGGSEPPKADPASAVRLTNVRATGTTQRVYEGRPLEQLVLTADVTGDLNALGGQPIYVVVEEPSQLFRRDPLLAISPNGIDNRVTLMTGDTAGRAGSYKAPLRLFVCLDPACTRPINGSPVAVAFSVDVLAGPKVGDASPLVIDLPFGAEPSALTVPVTLPEGMKEFTLSRPFDASRLVAVATGTTPGTITLTPPRLPVGSFTDKLVIEGFGTLNNISTLLTTSVPITIRVSAVAGVDGGFWPSALAVPAYRSAGAVQPLSTGGIALFQTADGTLYNQVSRVVYLPPDGSGNLDAAGIPWASAFVDAQLTPSAARVGVQPSPCVFVPFEGYRCVPPGRYEALVYVKTAAGQEFAKPLRVTLTMIAD